MAATTEVGQFVKVSSAVSNTQNITLAAEPTAMIFFWTDNVSNDTRAITQIVGMGFTDFTNEQCIVNAVENTADPTDTYRRYTNSKSIVFLTPSSGVLLSEADVSKSGATVTVSWSTNSTNTPRIEYIAFYGTDITNATAGTFTLSAATGSQSYSSLAYQPDFVMFMSTGQTSADTSAAHATFSYGFAASSTEEAALCAVNRDAVATVDLFGYQRTDSCILVVGSGGAEVIRADFTSHDSNGFTFNKTTASAGAEVMFLAIKGGDWTTFSLNNSGSTGEQLVTGLGLTPKGAFFASTLNNASTSILSEDTGVMLGAADGTNNASIYIADDDGGAAATVRGAASSTYSLMGGSFSTLNAQASVQSFSSGQIDLEWAANGGATDEIIGWAVADTPVVGGTTRRYSLPTLGVG